MSNETQQTNVPERQKQRLVIHPPGWRQADESQEQWNRVHAQLLKSVADAQAKLLAAQNEITDQLSLQRKLLANFGERLDLYVAFPEAFHQLKNALSNRLDVLAALLPPPRRPVERLRTKRIVKARKQRR